MSPENIRNVPEDLPREAPRQVTSRQARQQCPGTGVAHLPPTSIRRIVAQRWRSECSRLVLHPCSKRTIRRTTGPGWLALMCA